MDKDCFKEIQSREEHNPLEKVMSTTGVSSSLITDVEALNDTLSIGVSVYLLHVPDYLVHIIPKCLSREGKQDNRGILGQIDRTPRILSFLQIQPQTLDHIPCCVIKELYQMSLK